MPSMPDLPRAPVTTFDSLSDDVLLMIIDEAKKIRLDYSTTYYKPIVFALSLVNKRLRALAIPKVLNFDHLTIKLGGAEDDLNARLEALRTSKLAGSNVKALSVGFSQSNQATGTGKPGEFFLSAIQELDSVRELRLSGLKTLDRKTKATLRKVEFESIEILQLDQVPDAALFIRSCQNLQTVRGVFPCPKLKATFQALADSSIDNLELENTKGWRVAELTELREYLGSISNLCLRGEIKAKVSELLACLPGLPNIKSFGITLDPVVNYAYYGRHYVDDRYLDAIDDAKDNSHLNEDQNTIFRAIFNTFRSAETAWVLPRFEAEQSGVVRNDDGTVASLSPQPLRPSGAEYDFDYSPFDMVFPKRSMFAHD